MVVLMLVRFLSTKMSVMLSTKLSMASFYRRKILLNALIATLCSLPLVSHALSVEVDRQIIPINETIRLTILSNGSGDLSDIDLTPIEKYFEIGNRSSQRSFSMINGRTESIKKLTLTLSPKKLGSYWIPSLTFAKESSKALKIKVIKALPVASKLSNNMVIVEAEVDKKSVLEGEQLLFTLRIIYRVQFNNAVVPSLELSHADVIPLEDRNSQREIDGYTYTVVEKRYALFIQQPGVFEIPSQSLDAVISTSSRSRFGYDPFSRGEKIRLESRPITIDVKEKPTDSIGIDWLPAQSLYLTESWSTDLDKVHVGEPITRAISIFAKGLAAENLPAPSLESVAGLNLYNEKPEFTNQQWTGGIAGKRTDTFALVPTRAGRYTLAAISVKWWNTVLGQWENTTLEKKIITVLPAIDQAADEQIDNQRAINSQNNGNQASESPVATADKQLTSDDSAMTAASNAPLIQSDLETQTSASFWKILALVAMSGWLATAIGIFIIRKSQPNRYQQRSIDTNDKNDSSLKQSAKALKNACQNHDPLEAKKALPQWLNAYAQQQVANGQRQYLSAKSASDIVTKIKSDLLNQAISDLDKILFSTEKKSSVWNGLALLEAVTEVKACRPKQTQALAPLYPS